MGREHLLFIYIQKLLLFFDAYIVLIIVLKYCPKLISNHFYLLFLLTYMKMLKDTEIDENAKCSIYIKSV